MKRFFTARLLLIHSIAVFVLAICAWFAQWQWDRAHVIRVNEQASTPTQFEQLSIVKDFLPVTSVGAKTFVSGVWQPQGRFYLAKRPADGRLLLDTLSNRKMLSATNSGVWVVDLLRLNDGTSVAVVRGWDTKQKVSVPETGRQQITGIVQPSEDAPGVDLVPLTELLTTTEILSHSTTDVRDGFIVQSNTGDALQAVTPTRAPTTTNEIHWRNIVYTINWIFFGVLAILMWIRVIREETSQDNTDAAS